ncbi:MAG: DMT family transporter [Paracoccaceae bacterium]|nr:DMT family transporter [Paracoccaceae bacterium]
MTEQNVPRAIAAIVFAVFALSLGDAIIKLMSVGFQVWQLFVLRSLLIIPVFLVMMRRQRVQNWWPIAPYWTALRSLLLALMWVAYYIALPHVPLSNAAAAFYTLPLFIALLSALFAGVPVGIKGWIAVTLGFIGVLILLKPEASGFNAYALLPLLSAFLYAVAMLLTGTKCQQEDTLVMSIASAIAHLVVGGIVNVILFISPTEGEGFVWGPWLSLGTMHILALIALALAMLIGSYYTVVAYQSARAVTVSTFDYSYLVFAVIWGMMFFGEFPDAVSLIGIGFIAVAGMIALRR